MGSFLCSGYPEKNLGSSLIPRVGFHKVLEDIDVHVSEGQDVIFSLLFRYRIRPVSVSYNLSFV